MLSCIKYANSEIDHNEDEIQIGECDEELLVSGSSIQAPCPEEEDEQNQEPFSGHEYEEKPALNSMEESHNLDRYLESEERLV